MTNKLPVGAPVDSKPAPLPGPVTLTGRYGRLEWLSAERHTADFWEAVRGHDDIWAYIPAGPFAERAAFADYMVACEQSKTRYFYAVIDTAGRTVGILSLMEIRPEMRVIEVGKPVPTVAQVLPLVDVYTASALAAANQRVVPPEAVTITLVWTPERRRVQVNAPPKGTRS